MFCVTVSDKCLDSFIGFVHIHTPALTSNDCEGAGEVFNVIKKGESGLVTNTISFFVIYKINGDL